MDRINENDVAIVDLGSNSFHLLIVRHNQNLPQVIYRSKESIHLAAGLDDNTLLCAESIEKGVQCLKKFAERLKTLQRHNIKVLATHTLRVAKNRNQFLLAASKVFPYPIEIISGHEEARLIYIGALTQELTRVHDTKLVIDIGGGSTEFALGQLPTEPFFVDSQPIGCVSFTQRFFSESVISKKAFHSAVMEAEQELEKMISFLNTHSVFKAYGSSGTIKCIHLVLIDLGYSDGLITKKRLLALIEIIFQSQSIKEVKFPSLSESRQSVLIGGIAILLAIFNQLKLKEIQYTQGALREGALEQIIKNEEYKNVCEKSVHQLIKQYQVDNDFSQEVLKIVKYFYKQWHSQADVKVSSRLKSILYWATLLHEIGLSINFSQIQKHSAYILEHSDLPGFNEEEQLLLATLVRYHRKTVKFNDLPNFNLFQDKQWQALLQILRLAILMDTQRAKNQHQKIVAIELRLIDGQINHFELLISAAFEQENQLMMADLIKEQNYWHAHSNWQLKLTVVD